MIQYWKNKVYNVETKQIEEAVVASIETSIIFTEVEKETLTEWIKARTNNDYVGLYMEVEPSENTGDEIEESLIEEESYYTKRTFFLYPFENGDKKNWNIIIKMVTLRHSWKWIRQR